MPEESRGNRKTLATFRQTRVNSPTEYSTPVTWVQKIPVLKLVSAPNNYPKPLEGGSFQRIPLSCSSNEWRSYHVDLNMDSIVTAVRHLFGLVTGARPQFRAHGGTAAENLALQNIQVIISPTLRSRC